MRFFKSRAGAAIVMIAVIALSTAFSVHRTLGAACREITDGFYNGEYDEDWGKARPSINSKLHERIESANSLWTVADKYDALSERARELMTARRALIDADGISEKYEANYALGKAFDAVYAAMTGVVTDAGDLEIAETCEYRFRGAQDVIDRSLYNESVSRFERSTLNVFPTNLLKVIVASEIPEKFE